MWFEITEMLIAVLENNFIVSFIIIFGTLSFPAEPPRLRQAVTDWCHKQEVTPDKNLR